MFLTSMPTGIHSRLIWWWRDLGQITHSLLRNSDIELSLRGILRGFGLEAFRQGLQQLGYVEGRSVIIEPRWPADIYDRIPELLRELLALNVQVIVAQGAVR